MKSVILLLCLLFFASFVTHAQWIRHKSEAKLAQMTPAQHVDEWVKEQRNHRFYLEDEQGALIRKYIMIDGKKAIPRLTEYIDQYNPLPFLKVSTKQHVNFDSCQIMLGWLDDFAVRLRASEEGRRAINALERSIERMRTAGYAVKSDEYNWGNIFIKVSMHGLDDAKGINSTDDAIKQTLRLKYSINLSDAELLELSNFLVAKYPEYPSWSKIINFRNFTRFNYAGYAGAGHTMREPKRFYEAYLEFEKTKN